MILQHERLPAEQPLFDLASPTTAQARHLGANSARSAKRTPLKRIRDRSPTIQRLRHPLQRRFGLLQPHRH
ncbi:glycerol dehydratase reactivase beta/small subunit family protein [Haladaptatus sp. AB618]|uniref:glycerol dehydratase reactivase beta/small subunit family protein n=1 Tax=Haladaptatus sp. AB618 TaxID=2934173 RepID=UPI0034E96AD5